MVEAIVVVANVVVAENDEVFVAEIEPIVWVPIVALAATSEVVEVNVPTDAVPIVAFAAVSD